MDNALRISLTPTDKDRSRIVGSIAVDRVDDLPAILNKGGYLKVTRDDSKEQWVNLDHILKVEESPKGEPQVRQLG